MSDRTCYNCGKPSGIWLYCSEQCRDEYRETQENAPRRPVCRFCGTELPPARHDAGYCLDNSSCRSLAHQSGPRDYRQSDDRTNLIHDAKDHKFKCVCQAPDCGSIFYVNEYALREGKRQPMYCSRACKQRAYRERKKQQV